MSVKLIGTARFRPFRNLWLLEELGVPYEYSPAHPRSKEAYETNPFGKVPTLQDGEFSLYESVAINTYLGDKFRSESLELVPAPGTFARGRYEQLVATIYGELDCQALWIHRKHEPSEVAKYLGGENREAVVVAQQWFDKVMDVLSVELGSGEYLMGETFSAADVLFVHCLNWAERIGWGSRWTGTTPELETIASYVERCRARPAYKRAKEIAQKDTAKLNLERL